MIYAVLYDEWDVSCHGPATNDEAIVAAVVGQVHTLINDLVERARQAGITLVVRPENGS
ncbi:MAG TPA: hypothetical protein VG650_14110 [Mycobacteriales bacterium]|nr:hypothetical protein [Mycobacteriales bacterium]